MRTGVQTYCDYTEVRKAKKDRSSVNRHSKEVRERSITKYRPCRGGGAGVSRLWDANEVQCLDLVM